MFRRRPKPPKPSCYAWCYLVPGYNFRCSRPQGHGGNHQAHGDDGEVIVLKSHDIEIRLEWRDP